MDGLWFAAMIVFLVAVGVATQVGWEFPEVPAIKRTLRRRKPPVDGATAPTTNP
jgi:hypothetical protein